MLQEAGPGTDNAAECPHTASATTAIATEMDSSRLEASARCAQVAQLPAGPLWSCEWFAWVKTYVAERSETEMNAMQIDSATICLKCCLFLLLVRISQSIVLSYCVRAESSIGKR